MKKKLFLFGIVMIFLVLIIEFVNSSRYCYQETANISTGCGGLNTGKYTTETGWLPNTNNICDGDWSTGSYSSAGANFFYINYTKPANATNESLLQVKTGNESESITRNLSIPSVCWNANSDFVFFRASSTVASDSLHWMCTNVSNNLISMKLEEYLTAFEEGIFWYMNTTDISNVSTTIYSTTNDTSSILYGYCNASNNYDENITTFAYIWYKNGEIYSSGLNPVPINASEKYLILTTSSINSSANIMQLINYRQTDYDVRMLFVDGLNYSQIQGNITKESGNLSYIFLIGNTTDVAKCTNGDYCYADINGDSLTNYAVGRFPSSNPTHINILINKTIAYETNKQFSKTKTLFVGGYDAGFTSSLWMQTYLEYYAVPNYVGWNITKNYCSDYNCLNGSKILIDYANQEQSLILSSSHGNKYGLALGTDLSGYSWFMGENVSQLTNNTFFPIFIAKACETLDYLSNYGGHLTLSYNSMISKLGFSSYLSSIYTMSGLGKLVNILYEKTLNEKTIGKALLNAKIDHFNLGYQDSTNERVGFQMFGDPALKLKYEGVTFIQNTNYLISTMNNAYLMAEDNWTFSCQAVNSLNSSWLNSSTLNIQNSPPYMENVNISSRTLTTQDDLYCNCSAMEYDDEKLMFYYFVHNGSNLYAFGNTSINFTSQQNINIYNLSHTLLFNNQTWNFSCIASDGTRNSSMMFTSVFVYGTKPTPISAEIFSADNTINYPLQGYCNATDLEFQEVSYEMVWYKNGEFNKSYIENNISICYQEFANESILCGNPEDGVYLATGGFPEQTKINLYDGKYSTESHGNVPDGYLYINYSKPIYSIGALWQMKDGNNFTNLTIPDKCLLNDILQLRVIAGWSGNLSEWNCWNSSDWFILNRDTSTMLIYEEAIFWNISKRIYHSQGLKINVDNISTNCLSIGDEWTTSCIAFDGTLNSSWFNSSILTIQANTTSYVHRAMQYRCIVNGTCVLYEGVEMLDNSEVDYDYLCNQVNCSKIT